MHTAIGLVNFKKGEISPQSTRNDREERLSVPALSVFQLPEGENCLQALGEINTQSQIEV